MPENNSGLPGAENRERPTGPQPQGNDGRGVEAAPPTGTISRPIPAGVSLRLYNDDLAPTTKQGRTWHAYNIFTLWANDVHSLGNYTFAIGLFALGLGGWQIMLVFLLGSVLLFVLLTLSGFIGERTGVPFPVMSRIGFGVQGAKLPAILRGAVAVVWFGIQTYLAAAVLRVLILALAPSLQPLDTNSFLGLSTLGWIAFIFLWVLQVFIVSFGMEMIRHYEAWAGPIILITMLALAIWTLSRADWSIAWSTSDALTGGIMWVRIFESAALWVVIYGTFVLNFCDFTRNVPSEGAIVRGNFFGIPLNMLFFAAIVVVLSGGQYKISGQIIESPADVVHDIPNTIFLILASLALIMLTIAVNLMANFVAPIYTLNTLFPRNLNFRRAAMISAIIGLIILPWNLYNTPAVIVYFLGGLGALLGPLFGVIIADYWLVRKGAVNVPDLYSDSPQGDYAYVRGVNRKAIAAFVPSATAALIVALVPALSSIAGFSWFIGAGLAAIIYLIIADRNAAFRSVDGEPIAVAPKH